MLKILLFAALPEEYRQFKRRTKPWQQLDRKLYRKYGRTLADKRLILVETGMGRKNILRSMTLAIREESPDLIGSFGFGGSLATALSVGRVSLGTNFQHRGDVNFPSIEPEVRTDILDDGVLRGFCRDHNITIARIVTLDRPQPKHQLSSCYHNFPTLVDMESYFVARVANESGVPFFCFRSVSDGLQDEIEYDLDEISSEGKIKFSKVAMLVVKKPHLLKAFYASWRRSVVAGRELANVLAAFLHLPAADLRLIGSDRCPPANDNYSRSAAT